MKVKPPKNTAATWDALWEDITPDEQMYRIEQQRRGIRWKRIRERVLQRFGTFSGLETIEVGAGLATVSCLMAMEGASISVLDYSPKALEICRRVLSNLGIEARLYEADGLALPADLLGKFDIAMSFGVTEHFLGEKRFKINESHFELLKPGGITFISVPNAWCLPYRTHKFAAETLGKFRMAEEYPYSRGELSRIAAGMGAESFSIFGDDLVDSLRWINPLRYARRLFHRPEPRTIRDERGTPLDAYLSYAIVLEARKASQA